VADYGVSAVGGCCGTTPTHLAVVVEAVRGLRPAARGPRYEPLVIFAAATGLRPGEWLALEQRDIDRDGHVLYVRRAFRNGRVKTPKTQASLRAETIALAALDQLP